MLSVAIAALLAGAPGRIQDTSVHVTFESKAARASELLKNLSQVAKIELQTSPQTESEILIVSVKDVPLSELMARIATATSGEWKQEGTTYRLIASTTIRRQEERNDLNRKIAEVNKAIALRISTEKNQEAQAVTNAKKAEAAAKTTVKADTKVKKSADDEDDKEDETEGIGGNLPEAEMFTGLLKELDPSVLAQVDSGERVVFSTDPTRTQRALAGNATSVINEFVQKHNATAVDQPADLGTEEVAGVTKEQMDLMRTMMRRQSGKIGAVAKALLVVSKADAGMMTMFGGGGSQVELKLYDAKGAIVYTAQSTLESGSGFSAAIQERIKAATDAATAAKPGATASKTAVKSTPVEYSEDSTAIMKAEGAVQNDSFRLTLSDDLIRKLYQPNLYDPLAYNVTDELLSYAKSIGKPFVADVPDEFATSTFMGQQTKMTVERVKKRIEDGETIQVLSDPTYTVLKPAHAVEARSSRADRLALTTLMRATEDKVVPTLDDMAAFALSSPRPNMESITGLYLMMFVPNSLMEAMQTGSNWNMLRLYGTLSSEQKSTLANGGKLALGSLTAGQRAEVEQLTYGAPVKLKVDDGKAPKDEDSIFGMGMEMAMGMMGGDSDYRTEPTEVAAGGLPSDGYIEAKVAQESFACPVPTPGSINMGVVGILGPTEMAFFQMMKTAPGAAGQSSMPSFGKLRIGQRQLINFTFHIASQVVIRQKLADQRLSKDAQIVAENGLPADFQKQIADKMASLKSGGLGAMMSGGFGGGQQIHP